MAIRLSTGLRNALLGITQPYIRALTTQTGVFGFTGTTITRASGSFITDGFMIGDVVRVIGATNSNNNKTYTLVNVEALTLTCVETVGTTEVAAAQVITIAAAGAYDVLSGTTYTGGSLRSIFQRGTLKVYTGSQPSSADNAPGSVTTLLTYSNLMLGVASGGIIAKDSTAWSAVCAATNTAGWFRFTTAADDSIAYPCRIDGSIGTSGSDLNIASTSLTSGRTYTIDTFELTMPISYGA